ncbi:MAG: cardiolipin synthase [Clostridia bacterium]|nr:cardiolipin synthase [Clostridia bacterium]
MKKSRGEKNIWVMLIKLAISLVVLAVQVLIFYVIFKGSAVLSTYFTTGTRVLQFIVVLYILYGHERLAYKIPWLIMIMFLPVAGIIIYFLWGASKVGKKMRMARDKTISNSYHLLQDDNKEIVEIEVKDKQTVKQVKLLKELSKYPVYANEGIEYLDIGETCFERMLDDMKNAKKYILIEFFIIAKGNLFNRIYDILEQKLKEGVKVTVMADGWGSFLRYPKHMLDELEDLGATVKKYNPLRFGVNTYINYRDHRKIVVIDGTIAYTGGINIADEYTNEQIRFGHWKDNGIRVVGKAVESYLVAFLKNYEIATNTTPDYKWYFDNKGICEECTNLQGYNMFFTDGPDNRKNPAESVYIQILNAAKDYVYIYTPYFVASPELLTAILNASYSGVDVRIITPHKPDKWYVHLTTRSYYEVLLEAGVKVYEYLPGFLHAKTFVSDDTTAIVGSINLDYRSLNLNYECGAWMYKTGTELAIKQDFINTMEKSQEISLDEVKNRNIFVKMLEAIINTFAPLL